MKERKKEEKKTDPIAIYGAMEKGDEKEQRDHQFISI